MCKQFKCKPWIIISTVAITILFAILVTTVTIILTEKPKQPKPRKKVFSKTLKIFDDDWLTRAEIEAKNSGKVIFPGTKWCGEGNISNSIHDLGQLREEDKCCRKHDNCPESIPGDKVNNYGLSDVGQNIALRCDCDKELFQCFKRVDSSISRTIGRIYFNYLGPKCFRKDYPIIECSKWDSKITFFNIFSVSRCIEYRLNTTQKKIYQWFDNPLF